MEDGIHEDGIHEETTEDVQGEPDARENAVSALELVLVFFIAVVHNVLAVNYVVAGWHHVETPALRALLRVFGCLIVDVVSLFFLVKGYTICNKVSDKTDSRVFQYNILKTVVPDLYLSTVIHFVIQALVCMKCQWSWAAIALSLVFMSPLADMREDNEYRGVNETSWIVQTQTVLALFSFTMIEQVKQLTSSSTRLMWVYVVMWSLSFTQCYVAVAHPVLTNSVSRNVLTNSLFFSTGVLIRVAHDTPAVAELITRFVNGRAIMVATVVMLFVALHHLDLYADTPQCVTMFTGAPCLWVFDICNARMLPVYVGFLFWYTSPEFKPWLGGPLETSLVETFQHVTSMLAELRNTGMAMLLYSEAISLALHSLLMFVIPAFVVRFMYAVIPLEIVAVLIVCVQWKRATSEKMGNVFDRLFAAVI